jgi:hypothetical protein
VIKKKTHFSFDFNPKENIFFQKVFFFGLISCGFDFEGAFVA